MKIYVEEKSIKAVGEVVGPSGEMNAEKYVELYWKENFVELMKEGKHGDAVGQNRYMYSEIKEYLGKDDTEHDFVKSQLPDENKKVADKRITKKVFEKQAYWEYKAKKKAGKAEVEGKEITIDQEHFKQHGEAFVEAMLRGMLTFDNPDDLFNEESGDYEYFGETLVPGDEGGYTPAVNWMESWVNPGFDKWAKGYGGTKTKKELESFMLEAETDYVKAAEDVLNDAFNAIPLAKKLNATFSLDSDSFGDYGYVVSMDKAGFEKARKSFLTQNITSNGKPNKVNSAIFYKISKDALINANYKEAKDMDIRCAVCMWYRGFGQFCSRFWVSVKPDFVSDKFVRLPAKAELKIANGNANSAMVLGAELNPLKRWIVAEIIVDDKGTPVSKRQIAGTFATEKKAQEIHQQFHAKNPNARVIQWGDFKRLHVTEVGKKKIKLSVVKENSNARNNVRTTGISKMPLDKKDIRMIGVSVGVRTMKADAIDLILGHIKNVKNKQEAIDTVQKVLESAYKLTVHSKRMIMTRDDVDLVLKMK